MASGPRKDPETRDQPLAAPARWPSYLAGIGAEAACVLALALAALLAVLLGRLAS